MNKENKLALSNVEGLIPELRFPEFKKEEDWKFKTIDELCDILNNIRKPISSGDRKKGSYPYYGASGIIDYVDDFLFNVRLLLVGEDGAKWGAYENTAFLVEGKYWVNNHAHVLKPNLINEKLLESYLVKLDLHPYITGAAPPKLTLGKLKEIPVPVPKNPKEQQKIASCLSSLDEVITAHSQKLELLKNHKKGLMQNLFPQEGETVPKFRFKEFEKDGEWVEKKLGEVGEFVGGGTPDTSIEGYWNGKIPWYTPTEVKNGNLNSSIRKITEFGLKNSSAKLLPKGTILITTRATIGDVAIADVQCTTNQGFQSLIVNDSEVNFFWFYWITQHKHELIKKASGSTFKEIGKNEIINIPTISPKNPIEQQKIASCLLSLDALITAQTDKIEQLKLHKKGLMQGLFPKIIS